MIRSPNESSLRLGQPLTMRCIFRVMNTKHTTLPHSFLENFPGRSLSIMSPASTQASPHNSFLDSNRSASSRKISSGVWPLETLKEFRSFCSPLGGQVRYLPFPASMFAVAKASRISFFLRVHSGCLGKLPWTLTYRDLQTHRPNSLLLFYQSFWFSLYGVCSFFFFFFHFSSNIKILCNDIRTNSPIKLSYNLF